MLTNCMKTAIMQPTYLPWPGYFSLIKNVKNFVFLDDVQFERRSWQCRNYLVIQNEAKILSVPTKNKGNFDENINNIKIDYETNWKKKHLLTIEQSYKKYKYFNEVFGIYEKHILSHYEMISDLNINLIKEISTYLKLDVNFLISSKFNINKKKDEKIVEILKKIPSNHYISPPGSKNYIEASDRFKDEDIKVTYQKYKSYDSLNEKNLSILHFLFKFGNSFVNDI